MQQHTSDSQAAGNKAPMPAGQEHHAACIQGMYARCTPQVYRVRVHAFITPHASYDLFGRCFTPPPLKPHIPPQCPPPPSTHTLLSTHQHTRKFPPPPQPPAPPPPPQTTHTVTHTVTHTHTRAHTSHMHTPAAHPVGVGVLPHGPALGVVMGAVGVQVEQVLGGVLTDAQVAHGAGGATSSRAHTLLDLTKGCGRGGRGCGQAAATQTDAVCVKSVFWASNRLKRTAVRPAMCCTCRVLSFPSCQSVRREC